MRKRVLIVGGGTAGWITACYLAKMLAADQPGGAEITLVESEDIGIIGVGEGTFPSIRKTLAGIGLDEAVLIREGNATFKQGIRFNGWVSGLPADRDSYFHPFQVAHQHSGIDLLPYWLLGVAGDKTWADVSTVQKRVVEQCRAPKLISQPNYAAPLNYAYHFDAVRFGGVLRDHALARGVRRIVDTVVNVVLADDGAIDHVTCRVSGDLSADLFIDCSGLRAELIGKALGSSFTSFRSQLFCNRAVTIQVPYEVPTAPIASCTIATAQEAGWTWDIGLQERRGLGYVYSTDHTSDERAEEVLRSYIGAQAVDLEARRLNFEAGFRRRQWVKNCVAIGLSAGFIEPLEATGIGFAEIAALMVANLFPWGGDYEAGARQFNAQMARRYEHVIDFIKLHYCLSGRNDTRFWLDNRASTSISDGLKDRLERWRYRPPSFLDVDLNHDIFNEDNWQYILYGMGFRTDLAGRAGALRYADEARAEFEDIRSQGDYALSIMPDHRRLVEEVRRNGFTAPKASAGGPAPHRGFV